MSYEEILTANPGLEVEADKVQRSVYAMVKTIRKNGLGTIAMMRIIAELGRVLAAGAIFTTLSDEHKVVFLGEIFDESIGVEPTALVGQIGWMGPEAVEKVSDGLKAGFGAFALQRLQGGEPGV